MTTRVINIHHNNPSDLPYVYIGRGAYLGNPFSTGPSRYPGTVPVRTTQDAIYGFAILLSRSATHQAEARRMKGKTLGCFCVPADCHGSLVIAPFADGQPIVEIIAGLRTRWYKDDPIVLASVDDAIDYGLRKIGIHGKKPI